MKDKIAIKKQGSFYVVTAGKSPYSEETKQYIKKYGHGDAASKPNHPLNRMKEADEHDMTSEEKKEYRKAIEQHFEKHIGKGWFEVLTKKEQTQYIKLHPQSKYAKK